jgi:2-polyprenyl-3-methyl-5-hydroxy-6-metoxy-1,4-benzoquinol methylase
MAVRTAKSFVKAAVSDFDNYHNVLRREIEPLLPAAYSRVMDVGCGSGVTSSWLKQRCPGAEAIGVEADLDAAREAGKVLDRVIAVNVEQSLDFIDEYFERIELLLLMDILEHLRDPWTFLHKIKSVVKDRGCIIASIPNVRNLKVLMPLIIQGQWRYGDCGLLDKTHLRFFTKKTIVELFDSAGLVVDLIAPTGPIAKNNIRSAAGLLALVLNKATGGAFTEFIAHQFLVRARKAA